MEKTIHRKVIDVNIGMPNEEELAARYGIQEKNETENNSIYKQNEAENDVIREQKQTIEKLLRKINEKNSKIDQLCTLLEVLEPIPGFSPEKYRKILNGEVDEALIDHRDSKIVSLAKKAQNLTMLLNKERASNENHRQQVAQLQASCNKFNDQITQLSEELRAKGSSRKTATTIRGEDEAILTRKELKESKNTIEEQKKRIAELVESEKALNKALEREVGEGVTAAQALSGDWRGRAQQIVMLKAKVQEHQ